MPNETLNIIEFQSRVMDRMVEFFEDYKTRHALSPQDHLLDRTVVDWLDDFNDYFTSEVFRIPANMELVEMPVEVTSNFYNCPNCNRDKAYCHCDEY